MMTMKNKSNGKKLLLLVPALFAALLMGFMFLSCDVGDEPDPPTGPETVYDPDFDETRPGINVRVNPRNVTVPDPVTGGDNDDIVVQAWFRDPSGMPVQGLQMNFTSDPVNPNFTFQPPASFTDGDGQASVNLVVAKTTPKGSYTVVAYTSPASAGPNAKGYGRFYVNVGEIVSMPANPALNPPSPTDQANVLPGTVTISPLCTTADSTSSLGNPVVYQFDCNGTLSGWLGAGVNSFTCNMTDNTVPAGGTATFAVRAQARSNTGVVSDWSNTTSVTVLDLP